MLERRLRGFLTVGLAGLLTTATLAEPPSHRSDIDPAQLEHAVSLSNAFKSAARVARHSVVHITAFDVIDDEERAERESVWPFGSSRLPDQRPLGQGSGVIVSSDGYVVTNNHVVATADALTLTLDDGREVEAKVIGTDRETDLAVLKIEASDLHPIEFGDSDVLEPGEWVLAVGNPFGLSHSVSSGIVSAIGRREMGLATYENFIQTDATINPGNSGGPLVNLYGEMIGINTAISTRNGVSNGIGFAIPSNMVKDIFERLVESGRVVRGWLGVHMVDLTEQVAMEAGYDGGTGVVLRPVRDRPSPARKAGIRDFDIVTRVNGHDIRNRTELLDVIAAIAPGEVAEIEVFRAGGGQTLEVTLGERPVDLR